jgi:hypothetical protein
MMANSFCFCYIVESRAHFFALDPIFKPNSSCFNGLELSDFITLNI